MWFQVRSLRVAQFLKQRGATFRQRKQRPRTPTNSARKPEQSLLRMVGDAEVGLIDGEKVFTYKAGKPVDSVDSARLKSEYPDVWEAVRKTRPGSRVLRGS
jgi:predicted phage-related endonuclease